jgi:hypothetical protein
MGRRQTAAGFYQCPPGILGSGLENADLLLATNAGKPILLTGERYDYFDRRGLMAAHDDIKLVYEQMGGTALADKVSSVLFLLQSCNHFDTEA